VLSATDTNTPKHVTHAPVQTPISGRHNLILVYAKKGNVILRYEDHTPASLLFRSVHLPTHIRQFLSTFVTCYLQQVCAATNDTYTKKGKSGLTNTNSSLLFFHFPNNVRRNGKEKTFLKELGYFFQTIQHGDMNTDTDML